MARKLSTDGRRFVLSARLADPAAQLTLTRPHHSIRTIIIATPFLVASSILMYKRLVLGEEQKHLPRPSQGPSREMIEAIKEAERKRGM
jgi:hypothetical protein